MSYKDIDLPTMKTVIDTLTPYFQTKDVSEHRLIAGSRVGASSATCAR
jgi:hypothetical protein